MKESEARRPARAWAWAGKTRRIFACVGGSAAGTAFLLFGAVNLFDVLDNFGWQAVDLPPLQFQLFSGWVAVRNFAGHTLLAVAPVYLFGRMARWLLVPAFVFVFGIEAACKYTELSWHASLPEIWISLLLNSSVDEAASFMKAVLTLMSIAGLLAFALALVLGVRALLRANYPRRSVRTCVCGVVLTLPFLRGNCKTRYGPYKAAASEMPPYPCTAGGTRSCASAAASEMPPYHCTLVGAHLRCARRRFCNCLYE